MERYTWRLLTLLGALLLLSACGARTSEGLPLADDRPTLLFFFTDN